MPSGSFRPFRPSARLLALSLVLAPGVTAGAAAAPPAVTPVRVAAPPAIDGRLDDPVWATAARITTFTQQQPTEGAPASEATEVMLAYDATQIYVGVHVRYADVSLVRANRSDRDQTTADDTITVSIDPFRDAQRAYAFSVNGFGVQADSLLMTNPGGTTVDSSWNVLYQAAGQLVEDGWTAEMAIPFKSLRYPAVEPGGAHHWGFQVQRDIRGKNEIATWAPLSNSVVAALGQMGTIEGMRDLALQRITELMPTVTSQQLAVRAPSGELLTRDVNEAGITAKYGVTSNLTLDVTVNPDFSQVETDVPQVQINQRFPLFFAELRPFFLEGQETFRVNGPFPYLHTRTIIDPQIGVKLTGKVGRWMIGALAANDASSGKLDDPADPAYGRKATVGALRLRYDIYREAYSGVFLVAREFQQTYSRVAVLDHNFRIGPSRTLGVTTSFTDHRDTAGVRRTGHFIDVGLVNQARHVSYIAAYHATSPGYRNDSGFVPRTDFRRAFGNISYRWWPEAAVVNWGPRVNYERGFDYAGTLTDEIRTLTWNTLFARNITVSGSASRNLERFRGVDFEKTRWSARAVLNSSRSVALTVDWSRGDEVRFVDAPFLGRTDVYSATVVLRPTARLQSEVRLSSTTFTDVRTNTQAFDVKIYYAKSSYQLTPRLLVRNILEVNTLNRTLLVNLVGTYRVNAGTVFFVGYDDRYRGDASLTGRATFDGAREDAGRQRTSRAIFAKLQYLYRR
ncbi:MAG: DUF5916 domain-containing protein [Vicinamibacterales bacterium]